MTLKWIVRLTHQIIALLRCELFFTILGKKISFFNKFIPNHSFYKEGSIRQVRRGGVNFNLDVSDYMQWFLYINANDISASTALQYVQENSAVLDIGANVGHFSLQLARRMMQNKIEGVGIHSFEPNPWIFDLLKKNLFINADLKSIVHLHQMAIGSENGEAEFISGRSNSGAGRFVAEEQGNLKVKTMNLQSFYFSLAIIKRVSFIKIDVEGFEPEVITGGWSLICEQRPVLYFEFTPSWCRERGVNAVETLLRLESIQYEMFYEKNCQMIPVAKNYDLLEQIYQTNILAIPIV